MANVVIRAKFSYTIMESTDKFSVSIYESLSPVNFPDGKAKRTVTVKGYNLPKEKGVLYSLEGDFEKYLKKGKVTYTLKAEKTSEILPTEQESILAYLVTLDGIGKTTAEKLYTLFDKKIFQIIEKSPDELTKVRGISKAKVSKIQTSFAIRRSAKELFDFLYPFGIKTNAIMRIFNIFGQHSVAKINENPYSILEVSGIGFKTADLIARKTGFHKDNPERIKAGIIEVLSQAEHGGEVFNKNTPYPSFMLNGYLRQPLFDALYEDATFTVGGTYLPRGILYLLSLKLLDIPVSEEDFEAFLLELNNDKKIYIFNLEDGNENIYRYSLAICELNQAETVNKLLKFPLPVCEDLLKTIKDKERDYSILLSEEQRAAVIQSLTNGISVITGGPGTGKTSIEKIILAVFKRYFPKEDVLLAAPTGKAAKRMHEQTGYPAMTLHKALGLYADSSGNMVETDQSMKFSQKLIIIDETSMVGSYLFSTLLSHIAAGTRLVLIGDVDQLPSIEVGAVLRELIASKSVPTTKLTKTFRQASGSNIVTNAARIKIGEKRLEYGEDFTFIECENSVTIAGKAGELIPKLVKQYGESEVLCLTAFRHKTESGSNALNALLREKLHPANDASKYFETKGTKIYEGDKVMNTKNTALLTNGDIGIVKNIIKTKESLVVTCDFDGSIVALEDEETASLELAYATTVHKSQGSEAACVVLTSDLAHSIMLKRNLFYTGVTRAKKKLIILGQKQAMDYSIDTQDCIFRRSQLGMLIAGYKEKTTSLEEPEQLSFL